MSTYVLVSESKFGLETQEESRVISTWQAEYEIGVSVILAAAYVLWNLLCYCMNHLQYPYSIQGVVPVPVAVVSYVLFPCFVGFLHIIGNILDAKLHGLPQEQPQNVVEDTP